MLCKLDCKHRFSLLSHEARSGVTPMSLSTGVQGLPPSKIRLTDLFPMAPTSRSFISSGHLNCVPRAKVHLQSNCHDETQSNCIARVHHGSDDTSSLHRLRQDGPSGCKLTAIVQMSWLWRLSSKATSEVFKKLFQHVWSRNSPFFRLKRQSFKGREKIT